MKSTALAAPADSVQRMAMAMVTTFHGDMKGKILQHKHKTQTAQCHEPL